MSDRRSSSLHSPQQCPEQEPQPNTNPPQDTGHSTEFLDQLAGTNVEGTAYIDVGDVDTLEGITTTDIYEGDTDRNQEGGEGTDENLDLLVEHELRVGETDDVMEAIEEGYTYVPPIDPPVVPSQDSRDSVIVADGFGLDSSDEQVEASEDAGDDMEAMVRQALRIDSSTTHLADRVAIAAFDSTVIVRGVVDDLEDSDNIVAVLSALPGIENVRDETTVRGL